jgi:hypothetical protein
VGTALDEHEPTARNLESQLWRARVQVDQIDRSAGRSLEGDL